MPAHDNTQNLPVKAFGVTNYRCFGNNGFILDKPRRVNVIIGKNNSGKSTLLRAIQLFARQWGVQDLPAIFDPTEDSFQRNGKAWRYSVNLDYNYLKSLVNNHPWHDSVEAMSKAVPNGIAVHFGTDEETSNQAIAELSIPYDIVDNRQIRNFCAGISGRQFHTAIADANIRQAISEGHIRHANKAVLEMLSGPLIIPVPRRFADGNPGGTRKKPFTVFDGTGVIEELAYCQHPPKPGAAADKAKACFELIHRFIRELLNESTLKLEIPYNEKEIVVSLHGHSRYLRDFGTGLYHIILMCAAFALEPNRTVYLEEPEIHLHPEIQRKFFRFILDHTANRYFITTHSSIFLDQSIRPDVAVYHVTHDGSQATVHRVDTPNSTGSVLRDLGCKPSDVLAANGVIWVEGPSDRVYLLKWLELFAPELREGDHFVFNWFGGANLSHVGFTDDTNLVPALCLNRNAVVVVDRDAVPGQPPSKRFVQRVAQEMGSACWVTEGWEVENYVRDVRVSNAYGGALPTGITVASGEKLTDVLKREAVGNLPCDKMSVARTLTERMTADDLNQLDLSQKIEWLARTIREWNHLSERPNRA